MSTDYHTPIATGAAANAATFNAPLGQLDAAITMGAGLLTTGTVAGATVQAQEFTKGVRTADTTTLVTGNTSSEFTLTSTPVGATDGTFATLIATSNYGGGVNAGAVIGLKGHGKITANYSNVVMGVEAVAESSSTNVTVADKSLYALRAYIVNSGTGSIPHAMGVKINTPVNSGGGSIDHNWGIYIADQSISALHGTAAIHIAGIGTDNALAFSGNNDDADNAKIYSDTAGSLAVTATAIGINTTTRKAANGLDISSGDISLCIGADLGATTRTNSTAKFGLCGVPHYTNTEEPATIFTTASNQYNNIIHVGGGSSSMNAATYIIFYTAADGVTVIGTERMRITEAGKVGIADNNPAEMLDVTGNINVTGVYKVDDVQVVGPRVVDARCDDVANSGDGTTDGLIDALRDAMIAHGLIAAA